MNDNASMERFPKRMVSQRGIISRNFSSHGRIGLGLQYIKNIGTFRADASASKMNKSHQIVDMKHNKLLTVRNILICWSPIS